MSEETTLVEAGTPCKQSRAKTNRFLSPADSALAGGRFCHTFFRNLLRCRDLNGCFTERYAEKCRPRFQISGSGI